MSTISPSNSEIPVKANLHTDSRLNETVVNSFQPRGSSSGMTPEQLNFSQTVICVRTPDTDEETSTPANSSGRYYSDLVDRIEKMPMEGREPGPVKRSNALTTWEEEIDLSFAFPDSPRVASRRFERLCSVDLGPRERPFPPLQLKNEPIQRSNALTTWED